MRVRRKKSLIEQASDYVESVIPKIEDAVSNALDKAGPLLADARDKAAPVISDARDSAGPVLADARDRAKPYLAAGAAAAAERAQLGASLAAEKAAQGRDLAQAKVAELQGKPVKKKGGTLKKILVITGLAAVAAFVAKKLNSGSQDTWQSSYTPAPAPTTAPPPATPVAAVEDEAGSSPDEALADAVDTAHPVTTPDDPADVTLIEGDPLTDPIETLDPPPSTKE